jgi:VCBS repeat-containing protein
VAVADTGSAGENELKLFDILSNDIDADAGDTKTLVAIGTVTVTSTNGSNDGINSSSAFSINSNQIQFAPGSLFDALDHDDTATVVVNYTMQDGQGALSTSALTLTVNGSNDAPAVAAALTQSAPEDSVLFTLDLLAGATDPDSGASLAVTDLSMLPEGVTLEADGRTISVNPTAAAFQGLAAGQQQAILISYQISDGQGGSIPQTATITITGTNDDPTVTGAPSQTAAEDSALFTLDLLAGANDADTGTLSVGNLSALPDGLTLEADGRTLSVDPSAAAFQGLAIGEQQLILISYEINDGQGGSVPQTASITITGTNDTPMVTSGPGAGAVTEDMTTAVTGSMPVSDVDAGAQQVWTVMGGDRSPARVLSL